MNHNTTKILLEKTAPALERIEHGGQDDNDLLPALFGLLLKQQISQHEQNQLVKSHAEKFSAKYEEDLNALRVKNIGFINQVTQTVSEI
jgi:hypothetical protein